MHFARRDDKLHAMLIWRPLSTVIVILIIGYYKRWLNTAFSLIGNLHEYSTKFIDFT